MWRTAIAGAAIAALVGCGGGAVCDAASLTSALASAAPGDVVKVGACTIDGNFTVPAMVTLEGTGDASTISASSGTAVTLTDATLTGMHVQANGAVGVRAIGSGAVSISNVHVVATRGVAIASTAPHLDLSAVTLYGPITAANASDTSYLRVVGGAVPAGACPSGTTCDCTPGDTMPDGTQACDATGHWATITAVAGLATMDSDVTATFLVVRGFASYGVVLSGGSSALTSSDVIGNLGVGLFLSGGDAMLEAVVVSQTFQGLRGTPAYGIVATDAHLTSNRLDVQSNERYGLVQIGSVGSHTALLATGNGDAAVWVGSSTSFALMGSSMLADNAFAGVVVVDSSNVMVDGATVMGTRATTRALGMFGSAHVGDGVHLVGTVGVVLRNMTLAGNERAGLLVDLGPTSAVVPMFDHVNVSSDGTALGAVAGHVATGAHQMASIGSGSWDSGITRSGAATTNDVAAGAMLDVAGVDAPGVVPSMDAVHAVVPMF